MRATAIEQHINAATEAVVEEPRNYLGISSWGTACERALWYKANGFKEKMRPARMFAIAQVGHLGESIVQTMLERAGFHVIGQQTEISDLDGKLKGHCDGIIIEGPAFPDVTYPALWENKFKGDKYWKQIAKKGVEEAEPGYWAQLHCYMAYLELPCALFTAVNRDSGELYLEVVQCNLAIAEKYQLRAIRVVEAGSPDEVGRISDDPDNWQCAWCDFRKECYGLQG